MIAQKFIDVNVIHVHYLFYAYAACFTVAHEKHVVPAFEFGNRLIIRNVKSLCKIHIFTLLPHYNRKAGNMKEKRTEDLEKILGSTHADDLEKYCAGNAESMLGDDTSFYGYIKEKIKEHGLSQQTVFLMADIPERYGYKLLTGEKRTRQRDIILRICYAAGLTLDETQRALRKYEMPELYAKIPRDALLMILFNERPGSIIEVNVCLKQHKMEPLRSSGSPE